MDIEAITIEPKQAFEEVKIRKNRREELTIVIPVLVRDQFAVQSYFTCFGDVQAGDDFRQGGLTTSIATDQKHYFGGAKGKIYRAEHKMTIVLLTMVGMNDAFELQEVEKNFGLRFVYWT